MIFWLILQNSTISFELQPENAIWIKSYYFESGDDELQILIPFLDLIKDMNDVRPVEFYLQKFFQGKKFDYLNRD